MHGQQLSECVLSQPGTHRRKEPCSIAAARCTPAAPTTLVPSSRRRSAQHPRSCHSSATRRRSRRLVQARAARVLLSLVACLTMVRSTNSSMASAREGAHQGRQSSLLAAGRGGWQMLIRQRPVARTNGVYIALISPRSSTAQGPTASGECWALGHHCAKRHDWAERSARSGNARSLDREVEPSERCRPLHQCRRRAQQQNVSDPCSVACWPFR